MTDYIEIVLATLLSHVRGHESERFVKGTAFSTLPDPTITITSSDCGLSGSKMSIDHTRDGKDLYPELNWNSVPGAKEYLIVSEDVDAPLPMPVTHGIIYGVPGDVTSVKNGDVEPVEGTRSKPVGRALKGGLTWKWAPNIRGMVYGGPRALKGHGEHRYFYQIVALKEPIDQEKLSEVPKKAELAKEIEGKVLAWGEWVGVSERKWNER
jgi:phosphatidylethanolamine-binding protein (PEBP) family uncharacterized protein